MRLGIDLGGTKIEILALDATGTERLRRRVATPAGDYDAIIAAIVGLVEGAERDLGQRGSVGIGTPGAISTRSGLMKNSNTTALNGRPLDADLARALARPVRLENDANCFALSEAADGAAAGAECVFGAILGTGVGGGVVVRGGLVSGRNHLGGEWGHAPLPWPHDDERPGPDCYCGKRGCIETFLSGPGLAADFARRTGRRLGAAAIADAAMAEDDAAMAALQAYADRLARALATVVNLIDPDVIVLGGGVSNIAALYTLVPPLLARYAFSDALDTRLVPARHGDSSGVRGAAWLWPAG